MNKLDLNNIWPEWEIKDLIGEGASGKVYKAQRTDGKEIYSAIKIVEIPQNESEIKEARLEDMSDESIKKYFKSFVDEFINEIDLLEDLKGAQNIVIIDDYKVIQQENKIGYIIYIRMELLTGVTNYFSENKVKERDVVCLGIDICKALEYCEKLKIIHRDIKPENIFVSKFGEYKLGDFGIARRLENTSSVMSKKGTYVYMAPEVYKGNTYDKTVDIYSLGLVMYKFCNNNRVPFLPESSQEITFRDKETALYKRLDGEKIPKPMQMSEKLYEIISKMCEYEPKNRYQNVSEIRKELEELLKSGMYNQIETSDILQDRTVSLFSQDVKSKKMEEAKQNTTPLANNFKQEEVIRKMKEIQNGGSIDKVNSNINKTIDDESKKIINTEKLNLSNNDTVDFTDKGNIKVKKQENSQPEQKSQTNKILIIFIIILFTILIGVIIFIILNKNNEKEISYSIKKQNLQASNQEANNTIIDTTETNSIYDNIQEFDSYNPTNPNNGKVVLLKLGKEKLEGYKYSDYDDSYKKVEFTIKSVENVKSEYITTSISGQYILSKCTLKVLTTTNEYKTAYLAVSFDKKGQNGTIEGGFNKYTSTTVFTRIYGVDEEDTETSTTNSIYDNIEEFDYSNPANSKNGKVVLLKLGKSKLEGYKYSDYDDSYKKVEFTIKSVEDVKSEYIMISNSGDYILSKCTLKVTTTSNESKTAYLAVTYNKKGQDVTIQGGYNQYTSTTTFMRIFGEYVEVEEQNNNNEASDNTENKNTKLEGYTEYKDSETGAKFAYPSNWINCGTNEVPVFGDNTTSATVNLITENIQSGTNLSAYLTASKMSIESAFTINGTIKEENIKVNGIDAVKLTYKISQNNIDMTLLQVLMIKDEKAYVYTFGSPTNVFDNVKDVFEKIISTIEI